MVSKAVSWKWVLLHSWISKLEFYKQNIYIEFEFCNMYRVDITNVILTQYMNNNLIFCIYVQLYAYIYA